MLIIRVIALNRVMDLDRAWGWLWVCEEGFWLIVNGISNMYRLNDIYRDGYVMRNRCR